MKARGRVTVEGVLPDVVAAPTPSIPVPEAMPSRPAVRSLRLGAGIGLGDVLG